MDKKVAAAIFHEATTTSTSDVVNLTGDVRSWQVAGSTSSGAGAATVVIEVSNVNDSNSFMELATLSIVLSTTLSSEGFTACIPWKYTRARVSAISGTGASIQVYTGVVPGGS
jgi:hypothetical protein